MPLHGDDGDTGIESAWAAAIVSDALVALKLPRVLIEFRCLAPNKTRCMSSMGVWTMPVV